MAAQPSESPPSPPSLLEIVFKTPDDKSGRHWSLKEKDLRYHQEYILIFCDGYQDYLDVQQSPRSMQLTLDVARMDGSRSNCSFCYAVLHGIFARDSKRPIKEPSSKWGTMELALTVPPNASTYTTRWMDPVASHLPRVSSLWLQLPSDANSALLQELPIRNALRLTRLDLDVPETPGPETLHWLPPADPKNEDEVAPNLRHISLIGAVLPPECLDPGNSPRKWRYPGVTTLTYRIGDYRLLKDLRRILDHVFPALTQIEIVLDPKRWDDVKVWQAAEARPIKPNVFILGHTHPGSHVKDMSWELDTAILPKQRSRESHGEAKGASEGLSSVDIYMPSNTAPIVSVDNVVLALRSNHKFDIKFFEYYF